MSKQKPREINEIQAEFQQVCAQAGHLQYQVLVHTKDLAALNDRLLALNKEAHARNLLNSKSKKGKEVALPKTESAPVEASNE